MRRAILICAAGLLLAAAPAAAAGGGPMPALQGQPVGAPGTSARYLAIVVGHRTLVEAIDPRGATQRWQLIPGSYGVPGAASDLSTTGLSANGRTLVLNQNTNNYPPTRTRLAVLDARRLRVVRHISLRGFFTVDAISPDGRWLYLIHYTSRRNLYAYEVRAYDLADDRLLATPVIDKREPDEKMAGTAMTRVYSPGGRWAYTLYQRPSGAPFVHALDTADRTAFCVDLPKGGNGQMQLALGPGGGTLRYAVDGVPAATIDTRTFVVTRPGATRPHPRHASAPKPSGGGGVPAWLTAVVALAAVAGLAGVAGLRRRRATYAG